MGQVGTLLALLSVLFKLQRIVANGGYYSTAKILPIYKKKHLLEVNVPVERAFLTSQQQLTFGFRVASLGLFLQRMLQVRPGPPCFSKAELGEEVWRYDPSARRDEDLVAAGRRSVSRCVSELLLQRFRHLRWWRAWQTEVDLDSVIDEPLQSSQSADHYDPREQTLPHRCHTPPPSQHNCQSSRTTRKL